MSSNGTGQSHYTEIPVILRFVTDHPIDLSEVRSLLAGHGPLMVAEVCYGELAETPDAPWTASWRQMQVVNQAFNKLLTSSL